MRRRRRCIGERRGRKQFTHARAESAEGAIVADGPETKPLCHTAHRLGLLAKSFMYNVMRIHISKNRIPGVLLALFCINRSFFARCPYTNTLIYTRELISL